MIADGACYRLANMLPADALHATNATQPKYSAGASIAPPPA
jgi:hypothetical protein